MVLQIRCVVFNNYSPTGHRVALVGAGRVGASLVRAWTLSGWSSIETPVSSATIVGGGSVAASLVRLLNGTRAIETTG